MKIICIGRNYSEHVTEMKSEAPENPVFFLKADSCLLTRNRPFYIPEFSNEIHYECELVLRISKVGKYIEERFAHRYYDAVTLGIDFTARDLQQECKKAGLPLAISKSFDGSACLGSFFSLTDIPDISSIPFRLYRNDMLVQSGNSAEMIFSFDQIIAFISRYMTLKTGDLIYTGTPAGVGEIEIGDSLTAYLANLPKPVIQMKIK